MDEGAVGTVYDFRKNWPDDLANIRLCNVEHAQVQLKIGLQLEGGTLCASGCDAFLAFNGRDHALAAFQRMRSQRPPPLSWIVRDKIIEDLPSFLKPGLQFGVYFFEPGTIRNLR